MLLLVLQGGSMPALAHEAGSYGARSKVERSIVSQLVSSPRPAPGVTAEVLSGRVPAILLDASSARQTVTVFDAAGAPFVRLGPRGVEVNMRSSGQADQVAPAEDMGRVRQSAAPPPQPRWRRIAPRPRYAWLEPRARYPAERLPEGLLTGGRRRVLLRWRIPLEVDGQRTELRGTTSWIPPPGSTASGAPGGLAGGSRVPIAALAALTVAGVVALVAVGRRAAKPGPSGGRPARD